MKVTEPEGVIPNLGSPTDGFSLPLSIKPQDNIISTERWSSPPCYFLKINQVAGAFAYVAVMVQFKALAWDIIVASFDALHAENIACLKAIQFPTDL